MDSRRGAHLWRFGEPPPRCVAFCSSIMAVRELAVIAALERDREAAFHAMLPAPLTAAVPSPAEIRSMTDELFGAEKQFLAGFQAP